MFFKISLFYTQPVFLSPFNPQSTLSLFYYSTFFISCAVLLVGLYISQFSQLHLIFILLVPSPTQYSHTVPFHIYVLPTCLQWQHDSEAVLISHNLSYLWLPIWLHKNLPFSLIGDCLSMQCRLDSAGGKDEKVLKLQFLLANMACVLNPCVCYNLVHLLWNFKAISLIVFTSDVRKAYSSFCVTQARPLFLSRLTASIFVTSSAKGLGGIAIANRAPFPNHSWVESAFCNIMQWVESVTNFPVKSGWP